MKVLYRYWCLWVYTISFRMLLSLALLVSWSPLWTAGAVIAVRVIAVRIWLLERAALNLWARVRWSTLWAPRAVIAVRVWLHGRCILSLWARVRWSVLFFVHLDPNFRGVFCLTLGQNEPNFKNRQFPLNLAWICQKLNGLTSGQKEPNFKNRRFIVSNRRKFDE